MAIFVFGVLVLVGTLPNGMASLQTARRQAAEVRVFQHLRAVYQSELDRAIGNDITGILANLSQPSTFYFDDRGNISRLQNGGTNPIAFACPRSGQPPLVIDLSLSKVARGKIMVAAQKGEAIPEGWALDAEGNATTDAKKALGGTMLPLGDAKGAALVLMVELLSAALSASHFGFEASSFFDAKGPPPRVGQLLLLIDPARFAGDAFAGRVETLLGAILGQAGTRLPGERRLKLRAAAALGGRQVQRLVRP
jgi:LDH2 family malate/lactate/ureidoglycolate dehydrogenase